MVFRRVSQIYIRFEKYISAVGLIYGFIFTSLTLTRVDTFWENLWIVVHLLVAASGIIALTYYENRPGRTEGTSLRFWLILVIQFAFGGLFSTFFVFYLRSSSLSTNWLFLLLLLILLVGNEVWKKHYARLAFQVSVLFVAVFLFLIFLLPVLVHRIGADLFIYAGLISLVIIAIFVRLLRRIAHERFKNDHRTLSTSILVTLCLMNVFYFTGIIPPIPLSLKDSGVFHSISRQADGNYIVESESRSWLDYFFRTPVFTKRIGDTAFAFSAVFSPVNFATRIIHEWQYFDEETNDWISRGQITLPIVGGRDGGFRTYSAKQTLEPGMWRVRVLTPQGQLIGNIKFRVVNGETVDLIQKKI